jgi:phage shock protein A
MSIISGLMLLVVIVGLLAVFAPSIYKKLKVKAHVAKERVEDMLSNPVEEAKYNIELAKNEIRDSKIKLAQLIAANKGMEARMRDEQQEVTKWGSLAERAAEAKNEADVTIAVQRQVAAENRLQRLHDDVIKNNTLINSIRERIAQHEERVENAEDNATSLEGRMQNAKLREQLSGIGENTEGLAALDEFEKQVELFEHKVEAQESLAPISDSLEKKYTVDSSVQDRVAQLMAK